MTPFAPELRRELDAETARLSDEVQWGIDAANHAGDAVTTEVEDAAAGEEGK